LPDRPRILAVLPGFIPSTMITVVKPLVNMHRAGRIFARIMLEWQAKRKDIAWADAIVFCRNTDPRYAPLLAAANARGTPVIYDLDDNLFDLPPDCAELARLRETSRQAMLEKYLKTAALVRVYSQPLADRVATLNPRIAQIFAPVDLSLMPPLSDDRPLGPIKIVYATSRTQDALHTIFWPALVRILSRYAGRVEAHFCGCRPPQNVTLPGIRHHGLICQYDRYLRCFSRAGYDIGLAPLPDDDFYRSKTNNKFREYGACGIAGIFSCNEVYCRCVRHEVSGLLVANADDDWYRAIERLIVDESLRMRIRRQAWQYVSEHHAQERFEQLFLEQLHGVLGGPGVSAPLQVESALPEAKTSALIDSCASAIHQARQSLHTMWQLGPRQSWTALRWLVNDRCLAAWLRWQLWEPDRRLSKQLRKCA
jgi:hypothetical protein